MFEPNQDFRTAPGVCPMVATQDVGTIAAGQLLSPPSRSRTVDVLGPGYTEREVAQLLGKALDRSLEVVNLPQPAWAGALVEAGFPAPVAHSLAELYRADEQGLLAPRGDHRELGRTPLEATIQRLAAGSDG